MTIYATVTNSGGGVTGRGGYRFDPGKTVDIEISASQFPEVYNHKDLNVTVTGADNPSEIKAVEAAGIDINLAVTDAARRLAEERGVDVFGLSGSGKSGRITVDDVRQASAQGADLNARDYIPQQGTHRATTLDDPGTQRTAQEDTREQWRASQVLGETEEAQAAIGEPSLPSQSGEAVGDKGEWSADAPRQDEAEQGKSDAPVKERSERPETVQPSEQSAESPKKTSE